MLWLVPVVWREDNFTIDTLRAGLVSRISTGETSRSLLDSLKDIKQEKVPQSDIHK